MRAALPFILVALAIFSAACIAYIAWDVTSDKKPPDEN
jgi:threonine/homoserine/homoserine lactone efflux protein